MLRIVQKASRGLSHRLLNCGTVLPALKGPGHMNHAASAKSGAASVMIDKARTLLESASCAWIEYENSTLKFDPARNRGYCRQGSVDLPWGVEFKGERIYG